MICCQLCGKSGAFFARSVGRYVCPPCAAALWARGDVVPRRAPASAPHWTERAEERGGR